MQTVRSAGEEEMRDAVYEEKRDVDAAALLAGIAVAMEEPCGVTEGLEGQATPFVTATSEVRYQGLNASSRYSARTDGFCCRALKHSQARG